MGVGLRITVLVAFVFGGNVCSIPRLGITTFGDRSATNGTVDECAESEDARLSFLELAEKYGHKGRQYEVVTEDGYILTVFRIDGRRGAAKRGAYPTLLFHGVLDSADTWILRGEGSLAVALARDGRDVWLGNNRGTRYCRRHRHFHMENDAEKYWNFTFDELGRYDLAATVDLVLNETGAERVNGIGHSQGTTMFYVLCSTRPEYNEKMNVIISLAPIAYLHHTPPPVSTLITLSPLLYLLGRLAHHYELAAEDSLMIRGLRAVCPLPVVGYAVCALGLFFPIAGYDPEELGPCFLRVLIDHYPAPASLKDASHFGQVGLRRKFAQYDYGEDRNRIAYNSSVPPEYELNKITAKVALLVGRNDHLSTVEDVEILRQQLPNVVAYKIISRPQCSHFDFVEGKHMALYLFPEIFSVLQKYGDI